MLFGSNTPVVGKASTMIVKPVEHVFQVIGDNFFENYPKWSTEVVELEALSDGPITVGTEARQVRVDHGRRSESTFKVTDFQPNRRIAFSGAGRGKDAPRSSAFRCIYDLNDARLSQPSTRVTFTFEVPELDAFMRPFEKLIRVAVQDGAEQTVRNLKGLIEKGAPSRTASTSGGSRTDETSL